MCRLLACAGWLLGAVAVALAVLAPVPVAAQPPAAASGERTISGVVVDAESLAPLAGALVTAGPATATTDANGRFSLGAAPGLVDVTVVAPGHFPLTTTLDVRAGDVRAAELSLAREAGFATSVAVVAAAPLAAPAAAIVPPVQVLRTPGALDNVYRTLQTLPGVAATEEFGSRLSVRGGSPDQNLTMMDGVEVHDPYRLFGLTSAFNPETIERFELATGGFSVKYGDRLSSLLVVENRDGRAGAGLNGSASLSITDANVVFEGGLPKGARGSWLVTGRRTYYDLVAERLTSQEFPGFADLQGRGSWAPTAGTRLTMFSLTSRQSANLEIDSDEARGDFQDDTDNDLGWLRFDASIGGRVQSRTTLGFSDTRSTFGVDASFQNTSQRSNAPGDDSIGTATVLFERGLGVKDVSLRQELVWGLGAHVLETGVDAHRLATSQRFQITGDRNPVAANGSSVQGGAGLPDLLVSSRSATRGGAWLQDTWQMAARVSLQGGLRLDHAGVTGDTLLSPRLSATVSPDGATRVVAAAGFYTQSPGDEKLAQSDYVLDFTSPEATSAEERTRLADLARYRAPAGRRGVAQARGLLQALHRRAPRPARTGRGPDGARGPLRLSGLAPVEHSHGAVHHHRADQRRPRPFLRLRRVPESARRRPAHRAGPATPGARLEREAYGRTYPFEYDRRHAFTMVSSLALTPRWAIAATTRVASGFPRTAPLGLRVAGREDVLDGDGDGVIDEILPAVDRNGRLEYTVDFGGASNLNGARLPVFARVDGRLTWRPRGAAGRWELYAEVINVLEPQERRRARPAAGVRRQRGPAAHRGGA